MSTPADAPAPGRRTAQVPRRRLDTVSVVALLLPLVTVALAFAVHAGDLPQPAAGAPSDVALDRASVICPPDPTGADDDSQAQVASISGAAGDVSVRTGTRSDSLTLQAHTPATVPSAGPPVVVTGRDDLAPGLVAGRLATSPLAAADCRPPATDQWFTGVGSGARHDSTLQLVNPDGGRALVDVVVLGREGPIDAPQLRGLTVPGGESVTVDLGTTVPRRYDLALHVTTLRGRVAASVSDRFDELAGGSASSEWLAAQAAPSTDNLLLGLPSGTGSRDLILANPGDEDGRATVRFVTPQSTFTPEGMTDVKLPAQSVVRVSVSQLLGAAGTDAAERPVGIEVESTVAATAGMLQRVDDDLVRSTPLPALTPDGGPGAVLVPAGTKDLVLGGALGPGVLTVSMWTADGRALDDQRIELADGQGTSWRMPAAARLVSLTPERTPVQASVVVSGDGATVVGVRQPQESGLVPQVQPALP